MGRTLWKWTLLACCIARRLSLCCSCYWFSLSNVRTSSELAVLLLQFIDNVIPTYFRTQWNRRWGKVIKKESSCTKKKKKEGRTEEIAQAGKCLPHKDWLIPRIHIKSQTYSCEPSSGEAVTSRSLALSVLGVESPGIGVLDSRLGVAM